LCEITETLLLLPQGTVMKELQITQTFAVNASYAVSEITPKNLTHVLKASFLKTVYKCWVSLCASKTPVIEYTNLTHLQYHAQ
jgi:hypothetical protein